MLLREVLAKQRPELLSGFSQDGRTYSIRTEDCEVVQNLVNSEFCATGLREDYEPNALGLALDDLLGKFSLE